MLQVKNLGKIYTSRARRQCVALEGINFTLPDKGMVFITGKSGSGKTTLLNLIGGLDSATSGEINIDGTIITDAENEGRSSPSFRQRASSV